MRDISSRLGGPIHVTHCNDYTNHSLVKSNLGSLTASGMAKINKTGIFFSVRVKLTLTTFLYWKKQLENHPLCFLSPTFS